LAQGRDRRSQFDAQVDQIMRAFIDTITVQK
jgi:hypothetical protein